MIVECPDCYEKWEQQKEDQIRCPNCKKWYHLTDLGNWISGKVLEIIKED